jgi:hypothetical protein
MNPFDYEEMAWERLREMGREADNMRLAGKRMPIRDRIRLLAARAWLVAGLSSRRAPRYRARTGRTTLALWKLRSPNR